MGSLYSMHLCCLCIQTKIYTVDFAYNDFGCNDSLPIMMVFISPGKNFFLRAFKFGSISALLFPQNILFIYSDSCKFSLQFINVSLAMWSHHTNS